MARAREPLSRERIVNAAVKISDADGIAKLSMRRLANELGFEVMSLYNHVKNKDDLLGAMLEAIALEIDCPEGLDWRSAMRQQAISKRELFEAHPWATALWPSMLPGPNRFDLMEWELRTLEAAELNEHQAHDAFHAIGNHVLGYALVESALMPDLDIKELENIARAYEQGLDQDRYQLVRSHIAQHLDGDHGPSFEYVLELLLDGIARSQ